MHRKQILQQILGAYYVPTVVSGRIYIGNKHPAFMVLTFFLQSIFYNSLLLRANSSHQTWLHSPLIC